MGPLSTMQPSIYIFVAITLVTVYISAVDGLQGKQSSQYRPTLCKLKDYQSKLVWPMLKEVACSYNTTSLELNEPTTVSCEKINFTCSAEMNPIPNHDFNGNVSILFVDGLSLDSDQMADWLTQNFPMAEIIQFTENTMKNYHLDLSKFQTLKRLQIVSASNISIRSDAFKLGDNIELFVVAQSDFRNGKLETGSIVIKDALCRTKRLNINLVSCHLAPELIDADPIQIQNSLDPQCLPSEEGSHVVLNFMNNSFSGRLPASIFKNLLENGTEMTRQNRKVLIKADPIDCCNPENSWLFNKTKDYRQYFAWLSCLPMNNTVLDFHGISDLNETCYASSKPAGWKVYVFLLAALILIFLLVVMIGYSLSRDSNTHERKARRVPKSGSRSASSGVRSGQSDSDRGQSYNSSKQATKSSERGSGLRKSKSPIRYSGRQLMSKKSDGAVLVQADSSAAAKSPSSPKFLRILPSKQRK